MEPNARQEEFLHSLSSSKIREQVVALDRTTRENDAWTGALWYEVETRTLWKEWGYSTFTDCVKEEQSRGYSTVMTCVGEYRYFVIETGMPFEEYVQLVIKLGTCKTSYLRQEITRPEEQSGTKVTYLRQEVQTWQEGSPAREKDADPGREEALHEGGTGDPPDLILVPQADTRQGDCPARTREQIQAAAERIESMSKREARQATRPALSSPLVYRRWRGSPEEDAVIQTALLHILKRADHQITLDTALVLLATEYLSTTALRGPLVDIRPAA